MIPFIPMIIGWLIKRRPSLTPSRAGFLANVIAVAGLVVFAGLGFAAFKVWDHFDDRAAVQLADERRAAAEAQAALEAEQRATRNAAIRELARQSASEHAKKEMADAETANPEAARAAAGPVTRAAASRLRPR